MTRALKILAILALLLSLIVLALLPPAAQTTPAPSAATVRGAFHIHSDRSDGSGSLDAIAAAAARAGLQFIILTDHGDGTRPPEPPSYRSGVLTIDAVELNTTGGHFAVLGLPAAPYPLAGTPADVIEDVRRLGGFGIVAHPGSPRASLSWREWDAAFDGLEWINADSEWRDEPRVPIVRAFLTYLVRPPESMARLLDRPAAVLERWDAIGSRRRVIAIAASDAHARLGLRRGTDPDRSSIHVPVPSYEASFRTFSNHVVLDGPLSGNAATDAPRVTDAIRQGRVYSVVDGLATPGSLSFSASSGGRTAQMGDDLAIEGDVLLRASASAPPGTTLVLLRNGQRVHEVTDGVLETNGGTEPAVYRVEAYTADGPGGPAVPWILSNPIYVGFTRVPEPPHVAAAPVSRIPARSAEAGAEKGANDTSTIRPMPLTDPRDRRFAGDPAIAWTFALSPGIAAGQFAAVRMPISGGLAAFDRIVFRVSSPKPVRAWVQMRAPVGNAERWGLTFYADAEPRVIDIPLRAFAPIGVTSSAQPPLDRVDALLFVIDTLNSLPGANGEMTISEVAFVK
jgi:hypothetical protein